MNKLLLFNLFIILLVWAIWYSYTYPDTLWVISENWPVTVTMIFGSFIAGATSEGGGAIAFPVFTKVLHILPRDAKVFSLAIQSVGMTAATFSIIVMRIKVEWRIVIWASMGGFLGVYSGAVFLAPLLSAGLLKMIFTALISSFALTLIIVSWKQRRYNETLAVFDTPEKLLLLIAGFIGGCMTGLVGNGIDIICFSLMVLLFRLPEKVSTPTSVVLMAINAIAGFALHLLIIGGFTETVQMYWLSAIPVVVVGAPLGAYMCTRMNNKTIAAVLIGLIFLELFSSLWLISLTTNIVSISLVVFFVFLYIYYQMARSIRYRPATGEI